MACRQRKETGSCNHYQCPFSHSTDHGYECVDVIDGYYECGDGCEPACLHSWLAEDEQAERKATRAFSAYYARQ